MSDILINVPHVYKITNLLNGKFYIGVHNGTKTKNYLGSGTAIRAAIKKYGKENFKKEIIAECIAPEEAYWLESLLITEEMINSDMCYNLKTGGFGGTTPSEETRQKMSEVNKGEKNPFFGKTHSEETRQKLSEAGKISGKKATENMTKEQLSERGKKIGKIGASKGGKKVMENGTNSMLKKIVCPHCFKESNIPNIKRYHFDNCKHKPISVTSPDISLLTPE